MIRTLVINLRRSAKRRDAIARQLDRLGMAFEFVEGVDGQQLTAEQLSLYSAREAFAGLGREMHRNEMGCILSHIGIWQSMIERGDEEILVIEDDMSIADDFPQLVESRAEWVPADARVVNFAWDMANPVEEVAISPKRKLCRFDREVMRTGTYLMRRAAAESLLQNAFPIRMPVDSLMGDARNIGGGMYGVSPRAVQWNDNLPTDTWTDTSMDTFSKQSRETVKGLIYRVMNRLTR